MLISKRILLFKSLPLFFFSEADAQLKAIEIESYNNYKLMANGLITETITHELHSLSKTGITPDASKHFDFLKDYFVQSSSVRTYNDHVVPIKNSYSNISGKLDQIGNLYSFLETTFIKKKKALMMSLSTKISKV